MVNSKILENKIIGLEKRVSELEKSLVAKDPLYEDAKRLVIKHGKSSLSFLQKMLFIDIDRAEKIKNQLQKEGIINT